jgi:hypothetical protein
MPNEAGQYAGGILSLLGGLAVGYRKKQLEGEALQNKRDYEDNVKPGVDAAIERGDTGWLKTNEPTLRKFHTKDVLDLNMRSAEASSQAQKIQRFTQGVQTLHSMMNPGQPDQQAQGMQQPTQQPMQDAGALGNPAAPTNVQPTQPAQAPQARQNVFDQMGIMPEVSMDTKGNMSLRTQQKPKEPKRSADEMKADAMATIAQNAAPNDPVGQAKSFLTQSVDLIRAGHVPNSLEANTAYGITESAHKAFPDDVQARSKYIVAASQAAKQYQEEHDPRLRIEQNRYDLSVRQYNRELNNDKENVRAKAQERLDTEINQIEARVAQNQGLMLKAEPTLVDAIKTGVGMKSNKYKAAGEIQTNISRDQEQLTRLQQLRASAAQGQNPAPTATPANPGGPPTAMTAPGGIPASIPVPPGKMRIRNNTTGKIELYPIMETPQGYSRLQ